MASPSPSQPSFATAEQTVSVFDIDDPNDKLATFKLWKWNVPIQTAYSGLWYFMFGIVVLTAALVAVAAFILMMRLPVWQTFYVSWITYFIFMFCFAMFVVTSIFFPSRRGKFPKCREFPQRCERIAFSKRGFVTAVIFSFMTIIWGITSGFIWGFMTDGNEYVKLVRLGSVQPDHFKVFLHFPGATTLQVQYQTASSPFQSSPLFHGSAGTLIVTGLTPNTQYWYQVLVDGKAFNDFAANQVVTTAPVAGSPSNFTFAFGSCVAGNQFKGKWPLGTDGTRAWTRHYDYERDPKFILFIGDYIYMDHPYFIGTTVEDYSVRYRQQMGSQDFLAIAQKLPTYWMFDDHELDDNWAQVPDLLGPRTAERCYLSRCFKYSDMYLSGLTTYRLFLGDTNPHTYNTTPDFAGRRREYYHYDYADTGFFVLDTRSFRLPPTQAGMDPNVSVPVLGPDQLADLKEWLLTSTSKFKFLATPQDFTLNFVYQSDLECWYLYRNERDAIVDFIRGNNISGVNFLSGDLHEPYVAEIATGIYEFSCSPLGTFTGGGSAVSPLKSGPDKLLWRDSNYNTYIGTARAFTCFIEIDTTGPAGKLTFDSFGTDGEQAVHLEFEQRGTGMFPIGVGP